MSVQKVEETTHWINNLVIIGKLHGSLRLCLNPHDLNKCVERDFFGIPSLDDIRAQLGGKSVFNVLSFKDGIYQFKLEEESSKLYTFSIPFGC